jgi:hypothetical protein
LPTALIREEPDPRGRNPFFAALWAILISAFVAPTIRTLQTKARSAVHRKKEFEQ